ADLVSAEEAAQLGLVNRVFPHDAFVDEVGRIAARIARGPLVSYRYMKENVNLSLTADFRTLLDREAVTHLRCGQTADHREGVAAFLEKREPRFQGRWRASGRWPSSPATSTRSSRTCARSSVSRSPSTTPASPSSA